jgi:hypothetical protein
MAVTTGTATLIAGLAAAGGAAYAGKKGEDAAENSLDAQERQNAANAAFIKEQVEKARGDALKLFEGSGKVRTEGYQRAIDTIRAYAPEQMRLLEAGYGNAQQQLRAGSTQFQNAILGLPITQEGYPASGSLNPNLSFLNTPATEVGDYENRPDPVITNPVTGTTTTPGTPAPISQAAIDARKAFKDSLTPEQRALTGNALEASLTPEQLKLLNSYKTLRATTPEEKARQTFMGSLSAEQLAMDGAARRESLTPEQQALRYDQRAVDTTVDAVTQAKMDFRASLTPEQLAMTPEQRRQSFTPRQREMLYDFQALQRGLSTGGTASDLDPLLGNAPPAPTNFVPGPNAASDASIAFKASLTPEQLAMGKSPERKASLTPAQQQLRAAAIAQRRQVAGLGG